mgnify:CR=1 FL=1
MTKMEIVPEALEAFKRHMPPLGKDYPEITIVTARSFEETRTRIVEKTGCPIKEAPSDSCLEYIHGDKGNAILIQSNAIPAIPRETAYNKEFFQHLLWHELGHFYAINSEPDNLHRFNNASEEAGMDKERFWRTKRGYWFWSEFIAESIANRIGYLIRSEGMNYHPELIEWDADTWIPVSDKVEDNLQMIYGDGIIDEYELAHYFAALLTDDMVMLYVEAARDGKLKNDDGSRCDEEPTYISKMAAELQPPMWELLKALQPQVEKEQFWLISQSDVERLGTLIFELDKTLSQLWSELDEEELPDEE